MDYLNSFMHDGSGGVPSKDAFLRQQSRTGRKEKQQRNVKQSTASAAAITVARRFAHQDFGQAMTDSDSSSLVQLSQKLPVIVLGFPKSGTTSIWSYFNCSNVRAQHFCAYGDLQDAPPCSKATMAECVLYNMAEGRRMFDGCGNYQVYAQIDGERPKSRGWGTLYENGTRIKDVAFGHFLPQHFNLEVIHNDYPEATFILPLRDPADWAKSVMHWFQMKRWILNEYMAHDSSITIPAKRAGFLDAFLQRVYVEHTQVVRDFVAKHPSHAYIEVNLTDPNAGSVMSKSFGLSDKCWGHHNKKESHDKLVRFPKAKAVDSISAEQQANGWKPIKLASPIISLGYPRSGLADLWAYFTCEGMPTQRRCAYGDVSDASPCDKGTMSECILNNMADERPMLEGCGDYQVFVQIDGERPKQPGLGMLMNDGSHRKDAAFGHFLPQHHQLERLHRENANATFLLPVKDAEEWALSVLGFFSMKRWIINEYMLHDSSIQFPDYGKPRKDFLMKIYQEHNDYVQHFFRDKQSTLVVVNTSDPNAGKILASSFNLHSSCWGTNGTRTEEEDVPKKTKLKKLDLSKVGELAIAKAVEREMKAAERKRQKEDELAAERMVHRTKLSLPEPVIVVGFPKSGTTSIWNYFNCSDVVAQHYCAYGEINDAPPCQRGTMASCIINNMGQNKPLFDKCGDYQVYAQIDGERPKQPGLGMRFENDTWSLAAPFSHFLPQVFNLDDIHRHYPDATFVLPLREPMVWAYSVMHWFMMKRWIINEYMSKNSSLEFDMIGYGDQRRAFLAKVYDDHSRNVREFVKKHPSHTLVEVNITDPNASKIMSYAFGLSETCWGHKNKKEEHAKIADRVVGALSQGKFVDAESVEDIPAPVVEFKKKLPLSLPVIVVGYPKSGTTSIYNFFTCSDVVTQHYCAYGDTSDAPPCEKGTMAECILMNMAEGNKMLEGCGDYQVFAQIDGERPRDKRKRIGMLFENGTRSLDAPYAHFLPQHFSLDKIHSDYPDATFVLPLREPQVWAYSVMHWFMMKRWLMNEYMAKNSSITLADIGYGDERRDFFAKIYQEHTDMIRAFVKNHPSHHLVEINITDPLAGTIMADAFDLDASCWAHHNKKEEHDKIANITNSKLTQPKEIQ
ncbi:hypothetical protein MPSEU_000786600 [Mayamaea pseudoterrestris]|nr:hypothetical protein MPSEU_000786600 [Mayamaea pseudoterrestris]